MLFQKILAGAAVFILIYVLASLITAGNRAALAVLVLSLIAFIACIIVLNALKLYMKRKKAERFANISATAIIGFALIFAVMAGTVVGTLKAEEGGRFHPGAETYAYIERYLSTRLSLRQKCLIVANRVFAHFVSCSIQG